MTGENNQLNENQLRERLDSLAQELEEKNRLADERLTQLKYLQADFDNYRKQFEKEKALIIEYASEKLITDLLVILDDFERALPSLESEKNREGVAMLYKKVQAILERYGLSPIESVGKKFDPLLHEVLCTEKCAAENGVVLEEIEKGYRLKSKVIRPSKVKIAEQCAGTEGENNG